MTHTMAATISNDIYTVTGSGMRVLTQLHVSYSAQIPLISLLEAYRTAGNTSVHFTITNPMGPSAISHTGWRDCTRLLESELTTAVCSCPSCLPQASWILLGGWSAFSGS